MQHTDAIDGRNAQAILVVIIKLVDSNNAAEGEEGADLPAQLALGLQPLRGTACDLPKIYPLAFRIRDR